MSVFKDKVLLITGGTGSFGNAVLRRFLDSDIKEIRILSRDEKKQDGFLCSDLLATEKHASSLYNTCIFEFRDPAARQTLNHIQKEEQEHGKALYDYMTANGMYS